MKTLKQFLLLILLSFIVVTKVNAATNPYKQITSWGDVNCTWYAWDQVYTKLGIALPGWGNAVDWYKDAQASGYAVGSTPKANSLVIWDNYENYGHVAFVDHVEGSTIYYWDSQKCYREMTQEENDKWWDCIVNETTSEEDSYKCDHLKVMERIPCSTSGEIEANKLVGYIYVTEKTSAPSNNQEPPKQESSNIEQPKQEEVKKSSNNKLSALSINNIEFEFNNELIEYNLNVKNEIEEIVIEATPEDEKAIVKIENSYKLEVGNNIITITVTAEDESTQNYILNINREEKIIKKDKQKKEKVVKKKSNKNIIFIGIIGLCTIICFIGSIIIYNKKKKEKN